MSTESTATVTSLVGSLAVTIAAPLVIALVPPPAPAIPAAFTEAYEALFGSCHSVGVTEPKGVVQALRAAQAWVRQSSRYASLVGWNQQVKETQATILEENAKDLSTYMAADMDNRFGLILTNAENASTGSYSSGQSPALNRARVGLPAGSSS